MGINRPDLESYLKDEDEEEMPKIESLPSLITPGDEKQMIAAKSRQYQLKKGYDRFIPGEIR